MGQKHYTKNIINTIVSQLGGEVFIALTGAKLLYKVNKKMNPVLICILPNHLNVKNNIDVITITYNIGIDLYEYAFINTKTRDKNILVSKINDVYAEDLIPIFEEQTGLFCW